ncbi:tape measure protein [Klebsiella pneumoniae]|uniref:tape measure protein n=1 Tax=Klebsiella pneumoniae TaxID=573 RepID=UPI001AAEB295|nr:tape measure protein [Klebsiella pneumoniae]MBO2813036.1 tape measure protein [Klebsiella pneumoniae]HCI4471609.1 tape measure protein [Klebsiella pneumoniae]HCI5620771.1 tape measure protein [Klebsiella pneumoniae]HCI6222826.1 tape measure protein [Klebsiella pneumoniae]HCI6235488.1 tape measure protein [Klebsiella pneumoniae]
MAGTFDAGSVIYEVDMDTSRLLAARREVDAALNGLNGSMGRLEASVNRTERSIGSMERTMSSLSGVAKGLLAALSVQQVASYADAWTELNNKVANSVRTGETQAEVMQRIFDVSQATQSSLNGTATLYARLERGTRTYNTSAEDLTRLTTIINQGFAVSGATAQEAENAIIQLSQGIASGVLRGEEFNSVSEQGSRLMVALADSMGVSIGQLRAMAAQGQLTTDVVVKGLLSQGDAIGKEFANTTVSIAKGLQVAGNNVTKFFGENSTVKSFAAGFRDSVITISENLETLGTVLTVVAGIMGSRYVGALAMSTAAKISDIAASRQQLIAENEQAQSALVAANSAQRKALADKEAALSSLALAQAEYNVAKGSAAEALALDALIAAKTRATMASATLAETELAQAAASTTAATAARNASVGIGLARGALSLIGGPAGAAMLAAGAIFYFWQKAQQAREEAIRFADSLDQVNESMKAMNNTQLRGTIADANKSIQAQEEYVRDLEDSIDKLKGEIDDYTARGKRFGTTIEQGNGLLKIASDKTDELNQKSRDLANAKEKLARTQATAAEASRTLTNNMLTSMGVHDSLIEKGTTLERVQGAVARAFGLTADEIDRANQAGQKFNPKSLQVSPPTEDGDKMILNLEEQNQLLKIHDERQRAVTKARMEAAKVTDNPNQIARAGELAGQIYDLNEAEKAREKAQNDSQSAANKAATEQENIANKLEQLRQESLLTADSTKELSREQAILQAQQSLGKGATQEQIALAGKYRGEIWDTANALKAQAAAEKLLPEARENASYQQDVKDLQTALAAKKITQQQYNQTSEQLEAQHQVNLAKIRAQQTVSPMQEARGQIDPVQQLANQHAQELALIQQFESQKGQITQRGLELMNAANTQYEQQRIAAQWEIWRQQNAGYEVAAAAFDSFAGNASNALTGIITGSMSVSEAMRSLGSTVLNSVINSFVQMGVEWLKSVIMGQAGMTAASGMAIAQGQLIAASMAPAAAMTSLATAGANAIPAQAGIASTVGMAQALSIAGARYNGGPVSAGGLYQVGEKGKPEIYQASTGKQYMIPGDNGKVISNKDMNGGQVQVNIQFYDQTSGGQHSFQALASQEGGVVTIEGFLTDLDRHGPMTSGMIGKFGLSTKANGAF